MSSGLTVRSALLLGVCCAPSAWGYTRALAPGGQPLRWESQPIKFQLDARGSDDAPVEKTFAAVRAGLRQWEQGCSAVRWEEQSARALLGRADDGVVGVQWLESGWCVDAQSCRGSAIALTTLTVKKDGRIVDADIELNGERFAFTAEETPREGYVDVAAVIAHEAGHVLGLGHETDGQSVMVDGKTRGSAARRTLAESDVKFACEIYPPEEEAPPRAGCAATGPSLNAGLWTLLLVARRHAR
jgi:hypothetical protein